MIEIKKYSDVSNIDRKYRTCAGCGIKVSDDNKTKTIIFKYNDGRNMRERSVNLCKMCYARLYMCMIQNFEPEIKERIGNNKTNI